MSLKRRSIVCLILARLSPLLIRRLNTLKAAVHPPVFKLTLRALSAPQQPACWEPIWVRLSIIDMLWMKHPSPLTVVSPCSPLISNREDVPPPDSRPVSRHTSRSTSLLPQVAYSQVSRTDVSSFSNGRTHTPSSTGHGHTPVKHTPVEYDSQYGYAVWQRTPELNGVI